MSAGLIGENYCIKSAIHFSLNSYRVSLNASHIPSIPPAALPSNVVREIALAPSRVGIYPPALEPIIIPSIIIDFRDIVVTKINVYYEQRITDAETFQSYYAYRA